MRIGVLGGTFDPVHSGHLELARAARRQCRLDKVLFVPAFIPPHKSARRDLTPAPYRYRMVEIALRGEPDFEITDIEFARTDLSYTVETLRELKKRHPEAELFLVLGADALAELEHWREPAEIRRLARIVAARRPGVAAPRLEGAEWLNMPESPLSSSEIRRELQTGGSPAPGALPRGVEEFIRQRKLYGTRP